MSQIPQGQLFEPVETALQPWRRACVACTKAKRQCTKEVPSCRRCSVKRIPCAYPPARNNPQPQITSSPTAADTGPTLFDDHDPAMTLEELSTSSSANAPPAPPTATTKATAKRQLAQAGEELAFFVPQSQTTNHDTEVIGNSANTGVPNGNWFLAEDTFVPEVRVPDTLLLDLNVDTSVEQMQHLIDLVKKWLKEWVTDGHSSLIHRQLYRTQMPRCVQDAYSTMSLYFLAKGPATQGTIHQILNDRVAQLVEDQMGEELLPVGLSGTGLQARELFDKLSRVQSLLAYQVVRLFDGDIRMRARAEADIPTLAAWRKDLWAQTRRSVAPATPGGDASTSALGQSLPFDGLLSLTEPVVTWKLWVLVESIRRTWLISSVVVEIYHYFKHGWSQCPGNVPFTLRAELWAAETAHAWSRAQSGRKPEGSGALFVCLHQQLDMMESTDPSQVHDLGHATLGLIWGLERMTKWNDSSRRSVENSQVGRLC
ncbi:hypothetical protein PG989_007430 [Apiospora arundinis]